MANLAGLPIDKDVKENLGKFVVVEPGKYRVVVISDELKDTKAGTGKLLELKLQIITGPNKGTELTDRLNIVNPSSVTQGIGQGTLKRICSITGVPFPPADTRKCYGIPMIVDVVVEEFQSNTTGDMIPSNKIRSYAPDMPDAAPEAPTEKKAAGSW
jgi:hypothetical protein